MSTGTKFLTAACVVLLASSGALAQSCFSDAFTYPNGPLAGNVGWAGTGAAGKVLVDTNQVKLDFSLGDGVGGNGNAAFALSCPACAADGKVTVIVHMRIDPANTNQGNNWSLEFNGSTGTNLARWFGTGLSATCRNGNTTGTPQNISSASFDELKAEITPGTRTTVYSFNGAVTNTIVWPSGVGSPTAITSVNIVHNNITGRAGILFMDDFSIVRCTGSCNTDVTPATSDTLDNFVSESPLGGPAFPPSLTYTLTNQSPSIAVNYTASEVNPDGSANDFPWLSVAPASGGPIAPAGTANIIASLTPPGIAGIYAGSVKITDSCNPANNNIRPVILTVGEAPCYVEPFQYADGELAPSGAWATTGAAGVVVISGGTARVNVDSAGGGGNVFATVNTGGCPPCEDGTITVVAKVKGAASNGNNSWALFIDDSGGGNFAQWYGTSSSLAPRINGTVAGLPSASLSTSSFDELKVVIDTIHHTTQFLQNGTSLGTVSHGLDRPGQGALAGTLGKITIERVSRGVGDGATGIPTIDDIQVLSCPGTCYASVKPKIGNTQVPYALTGGATAVGAPINFTLTNDGLENVSYSAQTVDINGSPFTYPWLSLTNPTGGPVAPGADNAGALTANIDTTGLPKGAQLGFVKITDTCNPTRAYLRNIELNIDDCATESFGTLPNGDLAAQPGWFTSTPLGVASPIQVLGGLVKITGQSLPISIDAQHINLANCPVCPDTDLVTDGKQGDDLVTVKVKIRGHTGGSALWQLHITNNNLATDVASWSGTASSVTPNTSGGAGNAQSLTGGGVFDQLVATINFNTNPVDGIPGNSTRFSFNGTNVATLGGVPNGGRVRNVRFVQIANDFSGDADPTVEFDDLVISRCVPGCHDPVFDVRNTNGDTVSDNLIDEKDLAAFEACTGTQIGNSHGHEPTLVPNPNLSILECGCMDVNHDQKIDINDFAVFQRCYTGSFGGPVDPNCDN